MAATTLAVALASGCGDPGPARPSHTTRDSAGVLVTVNDTLAGRLELGPRLTRIGSVDGPVSLYEVRHVFLTAGGGVAVVETSTGMVRFFDDTGRPVRRVGGVGEGPGEFGGLWWAASWSDSVLAYDAMYPGDISVFDPDGEFVRSSALPRVGDGGEVIPIGGWANGEVVLLRQRGPVEPRAGSPIEYGVYSVASDGSVGADLGLFPVGVYRGAQEAYARRASFAAAGELLFHAPGDRFEVRRFDRGGNLLGVSRVERPRLPVTDEDVDAYLTEVWEPMLARAAGTPLAERMRQLGDPVFPDSMPGYTEVLASPDGGVWARRIVGRADMLEAWRVDRADTPRVWDVFDAGGVYAGAIELPPRFEPMSLTNSLVAGVTRDATDVEFVEVYGWPAGSSPAGTGRR